MLWQRRYGRSPRPKVLLYTGNFRVWWFSPFCLDSLRDDRLRDAGKLGEGVTRISRKRVAAVAENRKGQKCGGVSYHRRLHDPAGVQPAKFQPYLLHFGDILSF
jgi:hypothetical protein